MLRASALVTLLFLSINQSISQSTPQTDCGIRQLALDYVNKLQSNSIAQSNKWSDPAFDALRLGAQCNKTKPSDQSITKSIENDWDDYVGLFPSPQAVDSTRRQAINQSIKLSRTNQVDCSMEVFVDANSQSNDPSVKGSKVNPVSTIQDALTMIRQARLQSNDQSNACITIREGIYYLDQSTSQTTDSRRAAIHLTTFDSNLVIRAYSSNNQYENVILSGGVPLQTDWQPYQNGIYQTKITQSIKTDWTAFNELYIPGNQTSYKQSFKQSPFASKRAIRAKAPNGDPSTTGLYSAHSSWVTRVSSWEPARTYGPNYDLEVSNPFRPNDTFPTFRLGYGGPANVFTPPQSIWAQQSPNAGSQYTVPSGLSYDSSILPVKTYANPKTGFVHAFHNGHWGSWVFAIDDITQSNNKNTVKFGVGGHQEARGSNTGAEWYIDNLFEELDDDLEWFFDSDQSMLYFKPNASNPVMPEVFVASQLPCLVSMVGSSIDEPVTDIRIEGVTFAHTSNTYMADYRVPSGGDWSVHTGATVYMHNTDSVVLSNNIFTQLGSSAISLFGYNLDSLIDSNDFSWLGDSGVILCGSTDQMDGISSLDQPTNTIVASNHFHETGIYIKQTSPIVQFLSRAPTYIGNVMYNMPRAGINVNDGFAGGMLMHGNAIFNSVRETSDHGPFNSWDRQPYIIPGADGQPTLTPVVSKISANLLLNSYSAVWPIDHDDGSSYYDDSFNLLVYGGYKTYLGHSKSVHDNFYLYPDSPRFDKTSQSIKQSNKRSPHYDGVNDIPWGTTCAEDAGPTPYVSGWDENWYNNECHLAKSGLLYSMWNCAVEHLFVTNTRNNTLYVPAATKPYVPCTKNGQSINLAWEDWQALNQDQQSTWHNEQPFDQVLNKARTLMGLPKVGEQANEWEHRHRMSKIMKMFE